MPSLPPVSAKLIADAEQFIAEFRRAERAAAGSTSKIGAEIDKLGHTLEKKFSFSDIGKSLLAGFGVGSGFGVASTAVGAIVDLFKDAEQAAKAAADSIKEVNRQYRELSDQTFEISLKGKRPGDVLTVRKGELQKAKEDVRAISETIAQLNADLAQAATNQGNSNLFEKYGRADLFSLQGTSQFWGDKIGGLLDDQMKLLAEKEKELNHAREMIMASEKELSDGVEKSLKDFFGPLDEQQKELDKLRKKAAEQSDFSGGGTMGLITVSSAIEAEAVNKQLKQMLDQGKSLVEMAHDLDAAKPFLFDPAQINAAITPLDVLKREVETTKKITDGLNQFFGPLDERQRELNEGAKKLEKGASEIGWSFQSAFEDAILEGEKFSDVLQGLEKDILRIALRSAITKPLGDWIGSGFTGGFSSLFSSMFGGGKASGGSVQAGTSYMVGEEGPEMFVPKASGTIIPNDKLSGGGNTYMIDARGADVGVVDRIAAALNALAGPGVVEQRALAAVSGGRRRGFAY